MKRSMPTLLITGSSGLIGTALMNHLANDYAVFGLDVREPDDLPAHARFAVVDLTSDTSVGHALQNVRDQCDGNKIASVIHLAAHYDFSGEASPLYDEVTVRGTERLLRELQDGFDVEQFVFSSTMLVHAPCEVGRHINENSPLDPKWEYPQSKLQTEELLRVQHGDIPVAILRIAGVYDDRCHSLPLAHQIQRIHEERMTSNVYPGDPRCGQAFLHLDDLVDAITAVVERRQQLPHEVALLLGEPQTLSYDELQRTLGRLLHDQEVETRKIAKQLAKAGAWVQDHLPFTGESFIKPWMIDRTDDHYALDIARAKRMLDWEPKRGLRETLPLMIQSLVVDPAAWYRDNGLDYQ